MVCVPGVVQASLHRDIGRIRFEFGNCWESPIPGAHCLVFGSVSSAEARGLYFGLAAAQGPGSSPLVQPWAMVAETPDGGVVAVASPTLASGMFYSAGQVNEGSVLTVGLDPRSVYEGGPQGGGIDAEFVRAFLLGQLDTRLTPIRGVRRLLPGNCLTWRPDRSVEVVPWWKMDTAQSDRLRGDQAVETYLAEFDRSLGELLPHAGALSSELSGGLDSTFMVAGMARWRNPAHEPIRGFVHAPVEKSLTGVGGNRVHDDSRYAEQMGEAYPGIVEVETVRNTAGVLALDAAQRFSRVSWWPSYNPANTVWMEQIKECARGRGSSYLFSGSRGNLAFSHDHRYALRDALVRGQGRRAMQGVSYLRDGDARWLTIARLGAQKPQASTNVMDRFLHADARTRFGGSIELAQTPRERYLHALYGLDRPHVAALNPRATGGLLVVDPYVTQGVVEVAAAIDPVEWLRGPWPRGLARTMMAGRVPDAIRLRTQRGSQAADVWWHMRDAHARYQNEVELLRDTPIVNTVVDADAVLKVVESWPWGYASPSPSANLINKVNRILATAEFVRYLSASIRDPAA